MKVNTLYQNDRVTRQQLKDASVFMLAHLLNEEEHKKVRLLIESHDVLRDQKTGHKLDGQLFPNNRSKYKFRLLLCRRLSKRKQLLTLAHELVHLKQFVRDELGITFKRNGMHFTKWNGEAINEDEHDWYDWPWEIDANGREYGLWRRYDNYIKRNGIRY